MAAAAFNPVPDGGIVVTGAVQLSWLLVPAAVGLGALHALEPGHEKTLMSLFLAGRRATVGNAVTVGVVVAATHTIVVVGLALLGVVASRIVSVDAVQHPLKVAGAVLLCVLGGG